MIRLLRTAAALPAVDRLAAELRRPPPDWAARRDARIREIVHHAYRYTPFYRRLWDAAGIDPRAITGAADLARLPVVERLAWRQAPDADILARGRGRPWLWFATGGTTGRPLNLPYTLRDDSRVVAGMIAVFRANGVRWRDHLAPSPTPQTPGAANVRRIGRVLYLSGRLAPEVELGLLAEGRFPIVRGMPWPTWRLVVRAMRQNRPLPPIRLLVVAAETLTGAVRRTLAAGLGCAVVAHFGTSDFGHVAAQCPEGRLHVYAPYIHVEILAGGQPAAPGQPGELALTNFCSHARPAVRVRNGDCAAWAEEPCPCGNPWPHFAFVAGRLMDVIETPGGRQVRWMQVEAALAALGDNLLGAQAEQTAPDTVVVRLCLRGATALAEARRALEALFDGLRVEVVQTDEFRVEKSGKTRPVIGFAA